MRTSSLHRASSHRSIRKSFKNVDFSVWGKECAASLLILVDFYSLWSGLEEGRLCNNLWRGGELTLESIIDKGSVTIPQAQAWFQILSVLWQEWKFWLTSLPPAICWLAHQLVFGICIYICICIFTISYRLSTYIKIVYNHFTLHAKTYWKRVKSKLKCLFHYFSFMYND